MNSLHMLVLGYLAVLGDARRVSGPFAGNDPVVDALLVQLFVIATACTGLALSTGLDERARADLRAAADVRGR